MKNFHRALHEFVDTQRDDIYSGIHKLFDCIFMDNKFSRFQFAQELRCSPVVLSALASS